MSVKAAGHVIFRQMGHPLRLEYLLLKSSYGEHHWGPPKGRVEEGEDTEAAALRELQEETGYTSSQISIDQNFRQVIHYVTSGKNKQVVYWLAKLRNPDDKVQLSEEHENHRWMTIEEVKESVKYENLRNVFLGADKYISSKSASFLDS